MQVGGPLRAQCVCRRVNNQDYAAPFPLRPPPPSGGLFFPPPPPPVPTRFEGVPRWKGPPGRACASATPWPSLVARCAAMETPDPPGSPMRRWRRAPGADAEGKHGPCTTQGWQPLLMGTSKLPPRPCLNRSVILRGRAWSRLLPARPQSRSGCALRWSTAGAWHQHGQRHLFNRRRAEGGGGPRPIGPWCCASAGPIVRRAFPGGSCSVSWSRRHPPPCPPPCQPLPLGGASTNPKPGGFSLRQLAAPLARSQPDRPSNAAPVSLRRPHGPGETERAGLQANRQRRANRCPPITIVKGGSFWSWAGPPSCG